MSLAIKPKPFSGELTWIIIMLGCIIHAAVYYLAVWKLVDLIRGG